MNAVGYGGETYGTAMLYEGVKHQQQIYKKKADLYGKRRA